VPLDLGAGDAPDRLHHDADHPYGHRRYETLATLGIGALLLLAGWEVIRNVFNRIVEGGAPEVQPLSLALLALTVPVNLFIVWYEGRRGRDLRSDLLLADATQTRVNLEVERIALLAKREALRVAMGRANRDMPEAYQKDLELATLPGAAEIAAAVRSLSKI